MKNILVFNVNWLGDVVFSSPVFRTLKEQFPDAMITCIAHPRVREIAASIPGVDRVMIFDEKGSHRSLLAKLDFVFKLRRLHFDTAFILRLSFTRTFLLWLAGIPRRYGYARKGWGWCLTKSLFSLNNTSHRSDQYLKIVELAGIVIEDRANQLVADPHARDMVVQQLQSLGWNGRDRLVAINCGGNWPLKRWPEGNFTELIRRVMTLPGVAVVVPGGESDLSLIERITLPLEKKPIVMAGRVDLKGMIALCSVLDILVSNDSGPLHVANAVGTAVIGIFGPTREEWTGPRGRGRRVILQHDLECNSTPCYDNVCRDNKCMQAVTVDEVFDAVQNLLGKGA